MLRCFIELWIIRLRFPKYCQAKVRDVYFNLRGEMQIVYYTQVSSEHVFRYVKPLLTLLEIYTKNIKTDGCGTNE